MRQLHSPIILGIAVMLLMVPLAKADLSDGLVLYLPFDEGSGTVANDFSGNNHDGVINGAAWTDGKFGKALNFNGVDNFVEVPYADDFAITDGITLGAWVTANIPFPLNWKGIVNARKSSYGPYLLQTGASPTNPLGEMGLFMGGGLTNWAWAQTTKSLDQNFHYLVGTYNPANGFHMYFDGVLDDGSNSGAASAKIDPDPGKEGITIGSNYGFADRWWNGIIDEVIIYNRALSADEVARLFKAPPVSAVSAVSSANKLTTTWGGIKGTE